MNLLKTLTFTQFIHLAGLGVATALTWAGIITVSEGLPIITALVGLGINTTSAP